MKYSKSEIKFLCFFNIDEGVRCTRSRGWIMRKFQEEARSSNIDDGEPAASLGEGAKRTNLPAIPS